MPTSELCHSESRAGTTRGGAAFFSEQVFGYMYITEGVSFRWESLFLDPNQVSMTLHVGSNLSIVFGQPFSFCSGKFRDQHWKNGQLVCGSAWWAGKAEKTWKHSIPGHR